ncbi:tRNA CCA-pyrophosphorylase [Buchnera aphidicola]|uniref:CCA-adding enzyme n=1 Tax=Buchnera aphidicola str. USDA (Myzus persicae) TaxID=1009856 RepID=W0P5I1_BUCMP|nr:tRNA CCA-pyrophosphorylase [Buchnera aphidicola]AHG60303.1 Cca [Buchnera aphidicola str. USDA (Myzus persicae)]AHG60881.1 Cca [Buchnera aphidicola str. W106 (Myzus persicae)]AHG61453.1 Cca [Buchnera aphidicola str. G002 (Myzus persicae)]AHG62026.1 Cca [Buchnera aphidicola str. F009 (Myzus persicae)]WAI03011.1 MAG: tRNA CCA-pyrophosphorylase [Buchnera aphidicola (Myzus persicae)]
MKIYLVGGAVRDSLLNLPIKDRDWVVVGATKQMLLEKNFQPVGKDFPVFLHPETHEEYALARKERKSGKGYTGFYTDSNSSVTLEDDLIRRDLTMNAIAEDQDGNHIDPFKGKKDIQCRLIRHVSEAFIEDPLRVLRTARFAASLIHLGFQIAKETMELMSIVVRKKELLYLTANRIWNETEKAFKTYNPHVYFQVLYSCKALQLFFPKMYFFYERDIFLKNNLLKKICNKDNILMGLAKISNFEKNVDIRFAYLCQFLSINQLFFFPSKIFYDTNSVSIVQSLCKSFHIPSSIRDIAVLNTGFYIFLKTIQSQSSKNIVRLFYKIDAWRKPDRIKKLAFLNDFNFLNQISTKLISFKSGCFLKKCFSIVKNVSIQLILDKGFKGNEIKDELMRIRIKKLQLWRLKNFKSHI